MTSRILPPSSTELQRSLADASALALDPTPIRWLADANRCPVEFLPWLAWARAVEGFDGATTEARQRELIRTAIQIHKRKGTVAAVRDIFRTLGLGEVTIEQGRTGYKRDGKRTRTAFNKRGVRADAWAEYRVICYTLLTTSQAALARKMLANIAPARCKLFELDFSQAALIRNGYARRNGSYTRGLT